MENSQNQFQIEILKNILQIYPDLKENHTKEFSAISNGKNNFIKFDNKNIYLNFINGDNKDLLIVAAGNTIDWNIENKAYFLPKTRKFGDTKYLGFYNKGKITGYGEYKLATKEEIKGFSDYKDFFSNEDDIKDHNFYKLINYIELDIPSNLIQSRKYLSLYKMLGFKKVKEYLDKKDIAYSLYKNGEIKVEEEKDTTLLGISKSDFDINIITFFLKETYQINSIKINQKDTSFLKIINDVIKNKNQIISEEQLYNILISLTVTNFLIFSGPSGTGKTSVVQKIAESLGGEFSKLPVKSNFTDESAILGYWNPLLSRYEGTETLKFLIDAYKREESELNFLLLDEMNLSKVENYFSTFLSEIDKLKNSEESKILLFETNITNPKQYENIKYFLADCFGKNYEDYKNNIEFNGNFKDGGESETDENLNFKSENIKSIKVFLKLKNNIKIIGTINEDETTNNISNKVLDRAQFINFEVGDLFGGDSKENLDIKPTYKDFLDRFYQEKLKIKANKEKVSKIVQCFLLPRPKGSGL